MAIYYAFYIIMSFLFFSLKKIDTKKKGSSYLKEGFIVITFLLLILIVGLRNEKMGYDLDGYLPSFHDLANRNWHDVLTMEHYLNYEKGYIVFNKAVGTILDNRNFFMFVCATVSMFPIALLICRHSMNPYTSIIIYLSLPLFLLMYSGLRQCIAIGLIAISFDYIERKKLLKFSIIVLIATLFHSSALCFFIAYPVYHAKVKRETAIFSFFLLPILWICKYPLFYVLSKLFEENAVPDNNGAVTLFIVFSFIYLFCVMFGDRNNPKINGLSNIFFIACAIQAMGGVHSIAIRAGYYFMLYLSLLLPEIFNQEDSSSNKKIDQPTIWFINICFITFGIYSIKTSSWAEAYPYYFFWEHYGY